MDILFEQLEYYSKHIQELPPTSILIPCYNIGLKFPSKTFSYTNVHMLEAIRLGQNNLPFYIEGVKLGEL